ncbi:hypothetical protein CHUAL_009664 [Chamberlinius hualienensis]
MDSSMEIDDQQMSSQGGIFFDDPNNDFMVFYNKYLENQKDIAERSLGQPPQQLIEDDLFADPNDDFMTYYQKYLEDQMMEITVQEPIDMDVDNNQVGGGVRFNPDDYYNIINSKVVNCPYLKTTATETTVDLQKINEIPPAQFYQKLEKVFDRIISDATRGANPWDKVRLYMNADSFDYAINTNYVNHNQLTGEYLTCKIEGIHQSNKNFQLGRDPIKFGHILYKNATTRSRKEIWQLSK